MKPKLLVTASTFPRWEGDTEPRFILDLSKALLKYFDVTVLVPAAIGAKDKEVLEGVNVIRYHYFPIHKWETLCYPGAIVPRIKEKKIRGLLVPFLFLGLWIKIKKILKDYDVVHAHWLIPQGIVQSFFKKEYLLTGHGGDVTSLNVGPIKKLKKQAILHADHVTVVSRALAKEVQRLTPGVNVTIQSMGCDLDKFSPQHRVENYFQQNEKKVVLFVGRLAEKKGVTYLIQAVKKLDVILVIVGEGPLEKQLRNEAKELRNVIFLGAKTHEELKVLYASADIFAAPSVTAKDGDKEGVPTTILEAMASGLPVVASESSGIPEVVVDGETGYLTKERNVEELTEKIERLLHDHEIYKKMALNSRKRAQQFDYKVVGKKYADLIMECCQKKK